MSWKSLRVFRGGEVVLGFYHVSERSDLLGEFHDGEANA